MNHAAHVAAPRESVLGLLAGFARRLSYGQLSMVAAVSGVAALIATVAASGSWVLLGICFIAWSFASWGMLFHEPTPHGGTARLVEFIIVGSASVVVVILLTAVFFWALGPRWML